MRTCTAKRVVQGLETSMRNFLAGIPLLADVRSPAMRPRHWDQLMTATKIVRGPLPSPMRTSIHAFCAYSVLVIAMHCACGCVFTGALTHLQPGLPRVLLQ